MIPGLQNTTCIFSQKALSEPSSPTLLSPVSLEADSKGPNRIVPKEKRMKICAELSFKRKQKAGVSL